MEPSGQIGRRINGYCSPQSAWLGIIDCLFDEIRRSFESSHDTLHYISNAIFQKSWKLSPKYVSHLKSNPIKIKPRYRQAQKKVA